MMAMSVNPAIEGNQRLSSGHCDPAAMIGPRSTVPMTYSGRIDGGVTNIRNPSSPHWRRSLQPGFRCLVPATPSADPTDLPGLDGKKVWTCFGLHDSRPLFALAGIWCDWTGTCRTLKDCDA